jgi:hypothetical protein
MIITGIISSIGIFIGIVFITLLIYDCIVGCVEQNQYQIPILDEGL